MLEPTVRAEIYVSINGRMSSPLARVGLTGPLIAPYEFAKTLRALADAIEQDPTLYDEATTVAP